MEKNSLRGTLRIVAETHPVLGSCHISAFVSDAGDTIRRMSVTVERSFIILKFYSETELFSIVKLLFSNTEFIPPSCAGLTGVSTGRHVINYKTKKPFTDALEVNFQIHALSTEIEQQQHASAFGPEDRATSNIILTDAPFHVNSQRMDPEAYRCLQCRFCRNRLFKSPKAFRKVLELPSEDWEELSSDWFCHTHKSSSVGSLFDKNQCENLYFSTLYYKLNYELLNSVSQDANELSCGRCHTSIGILEDPLDTSNQVKTAVVLRSKVIFSEQFSEGTYEDQMNDFNILLNLIRRHISTAPSCKICFDSKPVQVGERGTSLFLWVMDRKLYRYYRSLQLSGTDSEHHLDVIFSSVVRVLYDIDSRDSAKAASWRKDFSVEVEEVDQKTLLAFIKHLLNSSKSVPPSHRFVDKLMIGYICL